MDCKIDCVIDGKFGVIKITSGLQYSEKRVPLNTPIDVARWNVFVAKIKSMPEGKISASGTIPFPFGD